MMTSKHPRWIPATAAGGSVVLMCLGICAMLHPAAFALDDPVPAPCTGKTEGGSKGSVDCSKGAASCAFDPIDGQCVGEEITPLGGSHPYVPCVAGSPASNWRLMGKKCHKKIVCERADIQGVPTCDATGTTSHSYVARCENGGDCIVVPEPVP